MSRLFLFALVFLFSPRSNAQTKNFIDQPYIEVNGYADTLVTPNEIYMRIVISEKDTRDKISLEEQERKMIEVLKSINIDTDKELTTSDIESSYKFYLLKSKDIVKSKTYLLKIKTAMMASKVFLALEELEISNSSIDRVDHTELETLKNEMRTKAVTDAKQRAIALTKSLGQTVGNAIHIADEGNFTQNLQGKVMGLQVRGISTLDKANNYVPPIIEFEKIKISSTINVKFIIK
jgi:uncharacterized protein YggE